MAHLHGTSYLTEYMRPTVLVVCPRCSAQANAYAEKLTCSKCWLAGQQNSACQLCTGCPRAGNL